MKLPDLEYHRPASIAEAVDLLGRYEDAKVLAGGQSLIPVLALRLGVIGHLVDLAGVVGLATISQDSGWLRVGALVRHSELERYRGLATAAPLLAAAIPNIGHRAIRNRGTVCGSLAHADPAAELPAAAVALGAELVATGPGGSRVVSAAEFFTGYLSTALGQDEILTEVRFPLAPVGQGAAVEEVSRRHGDFAVVGAAATVQIKDGLVSAASLCLFGVAGLPLRLDEAEAALIGAPAGRGAWEKAGEIARGSTAPAPDDNGSTAYKQQLAAVTTRRCLERAARATGAMA